MIYILGRKDSSLYEKTTPVRLAEDFGLKCLKGLRRTHLTANDVLIRYGKDSFADKDFTVGTLLNSAESICYNSNKLANLAMLKQANIPIPDVWISPHHLTVGDLPVIRRKYFHSRGTDIKFVTSLNHIPRGDYYTKYIKAVREYRVLVFKDEALRIQLKYNADEDADQEFLIRNSGNGYKFLNVFKHWFRTERKIIKVSIKAVKACGLDFGAVDVIVDKDKKPFVLEVNTAPRLNRSGRELFMMALYGLLNEDPVVNDMELFTKLEPNTRLRLPIKFITHINDQEVDE